MCPRGGRARVAEAEALRVVDDRGDAAAKAPPVTAQARVLRAEPRDHERLVGGLVHDVLGDGPERQPPDGQGMPDSGHHVSGTGPDPEGGRVLLGLAAATVAEDDEREWPLGGLGVGHLGVRRHALGRIPEVGDEPAPGRAELRVPGVQCPAVVDERDRAHADRVGSGRLLRRVLLVAARGTASHRTNATGATAKCRAVRPRARQDRRLDRPAE